MAPQRHPSAIERRIQPKYKTKNEQIVAELREAAGATPPMDQRTVIKRKAAEISAAMALLHGGDWRVQIEPENGIVLIARRL